MSTFEDYGLTVGDVQSIMSTELHPLILLAFCHGIHTCSFFIALYYISRCLSSLTKSPITVFLVESTQPIRKRITLASIISFLWVANTVILSLYWEYVGRLFISHGISLETEFNFNFASDLRLALPMNVLRACTVFVADLILVCTQSQTSVKPLMSWNRFGAVGCCTAEI